MLKKLILYFLICKSSNSLELVKNSLSNLPKFICDAVDEISKQEIQTFAVIKLKNNFSSEFFNELYKCVPASVAMVQLDLTNAFAVIKLKDIKFVIVIGDYIDLVSP